MNNYVFYAIKEKLFKGESFNNAWFFCANFLNHQFYRKHFIRFNQNNFTTLIYGNLYQHLKTIFFLHTKLAELENLQRLLLQKNVLFF